MCLDDEGSFILCLFLSFFFVHALCDELLFQFVALLFIMLVEEHVEVADEMVALLVGCLRCDAVAPFDPGEH